MCIILTYMCIIYERACGARRSHENTALLCPESTNMRACARSSLERLRHCKTRVLAAVAPCVICDGMQCVGRSVTRRNPRRRLITCINTRASLYLIRSQRARKTHTLCDKNKTIEHSCTHKHTDTPRYQHQCT